MRHDARIKHGVPGIIAKQKTYLYRLRITDMLRNLMSALQTKEMKYYIVLLILFNILIAKTATGFEGYEMYPMRGNTIFPLIDVNVELSEIHISIDSKKDPWNEINIISEYVLDNRYKQDITFKVGFPIESICINNCTEMPVDFNVLVDGNVIKTTLISVEKSEILFKKNEKGDLPLIVWEVSFKPGERKIINITYKTEWLLDPGEESFEYDLSALYQWKGNVDKAYFELSLPQELIEHIKAKKDSEWPKISIRPPGYKIRSEAPRGKPRGICRTA